jgi:RNA polymerase sigma-70 factor, ECF subfamily
VTPDPERRRRFEALVAETQQPLERYLRRRASADDADDLLGDVLLTMWRRLDDIPEDRRLPWSYGVARRALLNHRRSRRRHLRLVERISAQPGLGHGFDPAGATDHPELAEALASLPESDLEVVTLWAWEGLEPREIAVVLGTTPNAVGLRLSRARKKLASLLERQDRARAGHRGDGHTGGTGP